MEEKIAEQFIDTKDPAIDYQESVHRSVKNQHCEFLNNI